MPMWSKNRFQGGEERIEEFEIIAGSEAVFHSINDEVKKLVGSEIIDTSVKDKDTLVITLYVRESCINQLPDSIIDLLPKRGKDGSLN